MKTTKKQPIVKRDYLKLTTIVLFVVVLVSSLYIYWNPSSLLNTISTSATSIFFSLIFSPLALFGAFFTILMLIDSWRKNHFIWFLFILLGPGIVALLYFLVQNPKLPRKYFRPVAWIALALFLVFWAPIAFSNLKDRINPFDVSKLRPTGNEISATVITKNLKDYKYEGQTTCREMTWDNKYYVELVGGSLTVPKDSKLRFNYSFSVGSNGGQNTEYESGNQSYEGQPNNTIDVPSIIGSPAEINKNLTSCQLEFWSTKN